MFEKLAAKIGVQCAAEVLLLVLGRMCHKNPQLWTQARALGVPWTPKSWSNLKRLQDVYNQGIRDALPVVEEDDDTWSTFGKRDTAESLVGGCGAAERPSLYFLHVFETKVAVHQYIQNLSWTIVRNKANRRFICPVCQPPA